MTHAQIDLAAPVTSAEFFGHPKGLAVLFATEMWERFCYYGNAGLIVLYMVKYLFEPSHVESVIGLGAIKGGLEFLLGPLDGQPFASQLFGLYTGFAYLAPILGGLLADRVLGQRRTVIVGAILMATGQFMMTFDALFLFALAALILGMGALKPNVSTQVGALYAPNDSRRDRAYSIFYVGINIGAFVAPLVCGTLAAWFGWHYGFAASGVGMLISLGIYLHGLRWLAPDDRRQPTAVPMEEQPLNSKERRALLALLLVCLLAIFFWATYDQQSNTLMLWAEDYTERSIDLIVWHGEIPAAWFLALNPLMIFAFTPVILRLWLWQATLGIRRTMVTKMAIACWCITFANLIMATAAFHVSAGGKASPLWLVTYFALVTVGELYLAPVGLSLITIVAPPRLRSLMMGIWLAMTFPADVFGGWLGGFWSTMTKVEFYLIIAAIAALGGATIWVLRPIVWSAWPDEIERLNPVRLAS
jgi:proton-dependent oligopeptide transporter, POT family